MALRSSNSRSLSPSSAFLPQRPCLGSATSQTMHKALRPKQPAELLPAAPIRPTPLGSPSALAQASSVACRKAESRSAWPTPVGRKIRPPAEEIIPSCSCGSDDEWSCLCGHHSRLSLGDAKHFGCWSPEGWRYRAEPGAGEIGPETRKPALGSAGCF